MKTLLRITELKLPIDHAEADLLTALVAKLGIRAEQVTRFVIFRRGYDSRKKADIQLVYTLDFEVPNAVAAYLLKKFKRDVNLLPTPDTSYKFVANEASLGTAHLRPVVIGFGPCGIMAALILAQMGLRPIILERGKVGRERTLDTWAFWRKGKLDPESNVQFGEGGAGTFSDGKLWSQVKDPKHYGRKVLEEFVKAGAPEEILYVSKPHVGTFRLVKMVEHIRATIISLGGEFRFQHKVVDIEFDADSASVSQKIIRAIVTEDAEGARETLRTDHVVLAIGHSARDTFKMLFDRGVYIEAKPFSIGFRIEHPQGLVDRARFGPSAGNAILGAADYKLVHHASNGRSVYSFCMCPGGTVVAATSEEGHVVTNGMSQYSRNERNANAGIVVGITPDDYPGHPLAGIAFQQQWESRAYELGGRNYYAPAQLVGDFVAGVASTTLGSVEPSYKPGVILTDLASALPDYAVVAIREAIVAFEKQIPGFFMADAVLTGVETRTSSPIRITRRDDDLQCLNVRGLFPAGEGAGYAGGIMSAGIDGIRVAEAVALSIVARK